MSSSNTTTTRRGISARLTIYIIVGLVTGAIVGQLLHSIAAPDGGTYTTVMTIFDFIGRTLFLGLLKMMIVPLILSSIIVGIAALGDVRNMGRIGLKTVVYYVSTMLIAVVIGLTIVTTLQPGRNIQPEQMTEAAASYTESAPANLSEEQKKQVPANFGEAMLNIVGSMIPSNPMAAIADPSIRALPIIFFAIFFGLVLTTIGARGSIVVNFFDAVFEVMTKMVELVIRLAPLGVFALVAYSIAQIGLEAYVGSTLLYVIAVLLGLAIHGVIVLPLILRFFGKTRPYDFMYRMRAALLTAFGTDSSSATLPVTIDTAITEGGCSKRAAGFVLPLGATINMDGTALFEAVAIVFIAQAYGVELGIVQLVVIAFTAVVTAVGVAGIPSGSIVMMPVIIAAVNQTLGDGATLIPDEGIGLILGIDRLLDMSRTTVNVWGDAVGAKIITESEPDAPSELFV